MKTEKIEELFEANAAFSYCGAGMMDIEDFTKAINQAEKEWYKELEKNLSGCLSPESATDTHIAIAHYRNKIQEKIKELKNEN